MIALAVPLGFLLLGLVAYMVGKRVNRTHEPDLDPEAAYRAAVELHAIRQRIDVALTRAELRRNADHTRREIERAISDTQKGR